MNANGRFACFDYSQRGRTQSLQSLTCCRCNTLLPLVPVVQKCCEDGRDTFAVLFEQRLGTAT